MPDKWKHRSKNMICRTCMWWVAKNHGPLGRCRRHAPTLNGWPAVFDEDWCGDHKLDESWFIGKAAEPLCPHCFGKDIHMPGCPEREPTDIDYCRECHSIGSHAPNCPFGE